MKYKTIREGQSGVCIVDEESNWTLVHCQIKDPYRDFIWLEHLVKQANETEKRKKTLYNILNSLLLMALNEPSLKEKVELLMVIETVEKVLDIMRCED